MNKQEIIEKTYCEKDLDKSKREYIRVTQNKGKTHFDICTKKTRTFINKFGKKEKQTTIKFKRNRAIFNHCVMCEQIDFDGTLTDENGYCASCVDWEQRMKPNCKTCNAKIPMTREQRKSRGNFCVACNAIAASTKATV